MKFILLFLISTSACFAFADAFYIDKDGIRYLCQPESQTSPGGAADCVNLAYSGPFSKDESIKLCAGAKSVAPAQCATKAYAGPFSKTESLALCVGAKTIGPADCAVKAYAGPFSKIESLNLCAKNGSVANADCAIKAYAGPYSKEEAISLCKENPALPLRMLNHMMTTSPAMRMRVNALSTQNIEKASEVK